MTATHVYAKPAERLDDLVARTLKNAQALIAAQGPRPLLPFRHQDLFREPVYTDGQPYDAGLDDEDEGGE
ncbi:hypothetical protein [Streptomyces sp. NPDC008092]|uniref:hypothetical protein n=1 Tax=Streptomyces sp. NPDC008092 TaxID=3364808 RepID=UPI0036ED0381